MDYFSDPFGLECFHGGKVVLVVMSFKHVGSVPMAGAAFGKMSWATGCLVLSGDSTHLLAFEAQPLTLK